MLTREEVERRLRDLNSRVWPEGQLQVVDLMSGQYRALLEAVQALYAERDALVAEGRLLREAVEHLARSVGENYPPEIDLAYETAVSVLTKATPLITAEVARVRRLEAVLEAAKAQDPPASANLARALAAYREGERPGGEV